MSLMTENSVKISTARTFSIKSSKKKRAYQVVFTKANVFPTNLALRQNRFKCVART